jgi:hypothetical protein
VTVPLDCSYWSTGDKEAPGKTGSECLRRNPAEFHTVELVPKATIHLHI